MRRRVPFLFALSIASGTAALVVSGVGCGSDEERAANRAASGGDDGPRVHGLTAEQAAQTLAKVGNRTITVGEFAEELASKGSFIRTRYSSPERRREFLDQMIRFELLAQEAERRNYDDLPEVVRTRKQVMIRRFMEERFEEGGGADAISADAVRAYYEAHPQEFHTPEQVRASHILVRDRATAERVLRELQENETDLRLYRTLSEQHNTDPETRDRFGDLRFFSRPNERTEGEPDVPDSVREAAFSIHEIGDFAAAPVRSDRGWHIVKLTGRRAAMHRTLEEAERPIRNRLWRDQREAAIQRLIDELMAEADVEQNLDLLSEVQVDVPEGELAHPQAAQTPPATRPTKRGNR